ncbi:MAG: LysM peptidoglycan-binding domain-containing protein [Pseudomonadota bacterium]
MRLSAILFGGIGVAAVAGLAYWVSTERENRGVDAGPAPVAEAPVARDDEGPVAAEEVVVATEPSAPTEPAPDQPVTAEALLEDAETASEEPAETVVVAETSPDEEVSPEPEVVSEGAPEPKPAAIAPTFDVVRIDPKGQALVAGQAAPGAEVEILLDGEVIARETADGTGAFVSIFRLTSAGGAARQLLLRSGRAESGETVIDTTALAEAEPDAPRLALGAEPDVPAGEAPALAGVSPSVAGTAPNAPQSLAEKSGSTDPPSPDQVGARLADAPGDLAETGAVSDPVIILPSAEGAAPVVVQPEAEELALLQPAAGGDAGAFRLDRISYAAGGALDLTGRGKPGHVVRVYANAEFTVEVVIVPAGQWRAEIDTATAERTQLLRFDEVDASGVVVNRVETPFTYAVEGGDKVLAEREVKIERGDYLWRIAEQYYGDGIRYSLIFSANAELIRDPDLIYPGQVFTVPELVDSD